MGNIYFEEKHFKDIDFSTTTITKGEYENCSFSNCNFSNANLSGISFSECQFNDCNMSMAKLSETAFRDIEFGGCKLLGLHFDHCKDFLFSATFDNCTLNLSSFYKLKLKRTLFKDCILHEVDFADADLTAANFNSCDLSGAVFENTILEKADFRTAYNYSINPELNKIKKAQFSAAGIAGLLDKYDIIIE